MNTTSPVTILLVEDDKILQELYLDRFSQEGLQVVQAFDGMEALQKLEEHPEVQLVMLDIMMPRLSGYDFLAQIKRNPVHHKTPVILVSALADIDDQAKGLQMGATDYITKGEMLPGKIVEKIKQYALASTQPASS